VAFSAANRSTWTCPEIMFINCFCTFLTKPDGDESAGGSH
jgi:hypothetical protein